MTKQWQLKQNIRDLAKAKNLTYTQARAQVLSTRVVGTLSPCGGGGRTTIAAMVALLAARDKQRVVILTPEPEVVQVLFDAWRLPIVQRPKVVPVPLLRAEFNMRLPDIHALVAQVQRVRLHFELVVVDFWRDPDLLVLRNELDWAILSLPLGRLFPSLGFLPRAEAVVTAFGRRTLALGLDSRCGDESEKEFEARARSRYQLAEELTRRRGGHWAGRFPHSFDPSERGALTPEFWWSARKVLKPVLSFRERSR